MAGARSLCIAKGAALRVADSVRANYKSCSNCSANMAREFHGVQKNIALHLLRERPHMNQPETIGPDHIHHHQHKECNGN
jgi:hypothetical protein